MRHLFACALAVALSACGAETRPVHTVEGPVDLTLEPLEPEPEPERRRPYLIQLEDRVDEVGEAAVAATGAAPLRYFPDDALLVVATPAEVARARALPGVRAAAPLKARWKIDPALAGLGAVERPDLLVELADGAAPEAVEAAISALGGETPGRPSSWLLEARLPAGAIETLAGRPEVLFVAPTPEFRVGNDRARVLLDGDATGEQLLSLAALGLRGQGQLVAVADSGLDEGSCFFVGDKVAGRDLLDSDGGDETGHGTHVAGSIAGDRNGDGLIDRRDGIAPAARLFVQDVGSKKSETLDLVPGDLGLLFGPAYRAGARIHSNSWGAPGSVYGPVSRSLDRFVAEHPDFLVLVANGNGGPDEGTVTNPATAKNLIAVGASARGALAGEVAYFSSRGPTSDGRIKPTLVAPGQGIESAAASRACSFTSKSGTSMATPLLAGAAAVARQYFVDGHYPTGSAVPGHGFAPSAALLRATLLAGATPVGAGEPMAGGFGRASLVGSFVPGEGRRLWVDDERTGLRVGEHATYEVEVDAQGPLRFALAWTDVPGTSGSGKPLVNDLDLVIDGPDGTFRGNAFSGGHSIAEGEADRRNVEELVSLPEARPGRYRIRVIADNVPRGRQPFALAAVGAVKIEERFTGLSNEDDGGDGGGTADGCSAASGPGTPLSFGLVALLGFVGRSITAAWPSRRRPRPGRTPVPAVRGTGAARPARPPPV